jgi:hypothetical protein
LGVVGKLVVLFAACAAVAAFAPGRASADVPCTPPAAATTWIDTPPPSLLPVFGKPGLVDAAGSGDFPAALRQAGAVTIHYDNYLRSRAGLPTSPADPATIVGKASSLFDYAVQQSGCATPWIAENELSGAGLETPWSDTNTVYRQNVLTYLQTLAARGARPFLLVNSAPYTGGDAAAWWQQVAAVADIVREDYFSDKRMYAMGPIVGNRTIRESIRASVGRFLAIGIPASRLGVMLGFESNTSARGRAGLDAPAWFEVVKWQALAARQVAQELHFSTIWSWGWTSYTGTTDPDFGHAACVWLWTRSRSLCNAPGAAGPGFNSSTTEGQLVFPAGVQCTVGKDKLRASTISQLEAVTGDREVAFTAAYARAIENRVATVTQAQMLAAEREVISNRFGGSRAAYEAALADAGVSLPLARSILGDEVRRERIERRMNVPAPTAAQVADFYASYPDLLVRPVKSKPAPSWLGGLAKGYALEATAPAGVFKLASRRTVELQTVDGSYAVRALGKAQPLGTMPLSVVAPAIRLALTSFARGDAFEQWTTRVQTAELVHATCRGDDLPAPGPAETSTFVPFLAVGASPLD